MLLTKISNPWLLVVLFNSYCAHAVPPVVTVEQIRATADSVRALQRFGDRQRNCLAWTTGISDVFKVPISFEWSYINEDWSSAKYPILEFSIEPGETLKQVLDRFCSATDGQLQWSRVDGIIYVWPTAKGRSESLLDIRINLNAQNISVWEAFLELSRQVNANSQDGRYLMPVANPIQDEHLPPLELRHNYVNLDLVNVTAREAACAIMARSPLRMKYRYNNPSMVSPDRPSVARISLWVYDENYRFLSHIPHPPSREEEIQWYNESNSVVPSDTNE